MQSNEEQLHETGIPQLRVFWGEEASEVNDFPPPDPTCQARCEWLRQEAYWAGRNRARRFSARLVA